MNPSCLALDILEKPLQLVGRDCQAYSIKVPILMSGEVRDPVGY